MFSVAVLAMGNINLPKSVPMIVKECFVHMNAAAASKYVKKKSTFSPAVVLSEPESSYR